MTLLGSGKSWCIRGFLFQTSDKQSPHCRVIGHHYSWPQRKSRWWCCPIVCGIKNSVSWLAIPVSIATFFIGFQILQQWHEHDTRAIAAAGATISTIRNLHSTKMWTKTSFLEKSNNTIIIYIYGMSSAYASACVHLLQVHITLYFHCCKISSHVTLFYTTFIE